MTGLNYVLHCLQAEFATLLVLAGVCAGGTATMPLAAAQTSQAAAVGAQAETPRPATSTGFDLIGVLREFGPLVVLVLWFAWRDGDREKRMANQISELETFQREFLAERLKLSIEALDKTSGALDKTSEAVDKLTSVVEKMTGVVDGCKHRGQQ